MKLSEMNPDQAFDLLSTITPCLQRLFSDSEFMAKITDGVKPLKENATQTERAEYDEMLKSTGINKISHILNALINRHRDVAMSIFAAVNLQSVDEFKRSATTITMLKTAKDIMSDKELINFFKSSAQ